jgi:hypothetical protein
MGRRLNWEGSRRELVRSPVQYDGLHVQKPQLYGRLCGVAPGSISDTITAMQVGIVAPRRIVYRQRVSPAGGDFAVIESAKIPSARPNTGGGAITEAFGVDRSAT